MSASLSMPLRPYQQRAVDAVAGVYCAIHRDSGMCYVGSSVNIRQRIFAHKSEAKRGGKMLFHRALREFGEGAFYFEILEVCPADQLLQREEFYITLLNSASLDGFNTLRKASAPNYGRSPSEATRARLSAAGTGKKRSAEFCAHASAIRKGVRLSEEHRAKISLARKGKKMGKMSEERRAALIARNIGRPCSPETRAKIRAAQVGRKIPAERVERHRALMTGRKASSETRAKMAASAKAYWEKRRAN
jgi:group I intron endonuclease